MYIPVVVSTMNPSISSLKEIEALLGDRRRFSGNATFFGDRKLYDESLLVFRQITSRDNYCSYLASKICRRLKDRSSGLADGELNICSIGCGDGEADYKVLSKVSEVLPNAVVDYFGIDINSTSCAQTEVKLANLPYKSIVINQGIEDVDPESLPKFDMVIVAHVHYYVKDRKILFDKALELTKAGTGEVEVITANHTDPIWLLCDALGHPQCTSDTLIKEFEEMGLQFTTENLPGVADFSRCVAENFCSNFAELGVSFFCQTDFCSYPPDVRSLSIRYIKSCLDEHGCCEDSSTALTVTTKYANN